MLRIALIGAGEHSSENHAPALRQLAQEQPEVLRLSAVCDLDLPRARRVAGEYGFERAADSIDRLFESERVDAVVAVVPVAAILAVTRKLLGHGVPLMIEKPLGASPAEAQALAAAVREAGVPVQVSLNRRYDPALNAALDWAKRQGPIRGIHGRMLRHNRLEPEFVWGTGLHLLDAMCHAVGPLRLSQMQKLPGAAGCARMAMVHNEAVSGCVEIMPACGRYDERITLWGEGYSVEARLGSAPPWRVRAWRQRKLEWTVQAPDGEPVFIQNGALAETRAFVEAVRTGGPLYPTVAEALPSALLAGQM